jgi:hypothetical protein
MERFSVVIREFHAEEGKLIYETYYFWSWNFSSSFSSSSEYDKWLWKVIRVTFKDHSIALHLAGCVLQHESRHHSTPRLTATAAAYITYSSGQNKNNVWFWLECIFSVIS